MAINLPVSPDNSKGQPKDVCLNRYVITHDKGKKRHPKLFGFGEETCESGMTVLHNLQVLQHYDCRNGFKGCFVTTKFGLLRVQTLP